MTSLSDDVHFHDDLMMSFVTYGDDGGQLNE